MVGEPDRVLAKAGSYPANNVAQELLEGLCGEVQDWSL